VALKDKFVDRLTAAQREELERQALALCRFWPQPRRPRRASRSGQGIPHPILAISFLALSGSFSA
jgi:hypothetical protein